jgi:tripartite ATP-independent transporter DctP family solute receptor
MKKLLGILLVLTTLIGAGSAMAADAPITLTYAEVNPLDSIVGQTGTFFKEKVEELSGGTIIIDIQASGVLGSEAQVLDGILAGGDTVDISRLSAFALTSYGCNKAMLLSIPYTFVSRDHYWNFVNSDMAADFLAEPQTLGLPLRGIMYGEEGFRHFFTKNEVTTIADLAGMKIRVSEDPVMTGMVADLGASPATIAFTELYSALQSGVVDAAEQPIANYYSNAFHEVAPYLVLDGHTLGAIQMVITDTAWAKLSEEQQGWIMEAGKLAQDFNAQLSANAEAEVLEKLKAEGCIVVEVADKAPWVEACQNTISSNTSAQAELYQQLLDLQ